MHVSVCVLADVITKLHAHLACIHKRDRNYIRKLLSTFRPVFNLVSPKCGILLNYIYCTISIYISAVRRIDKIYCLLAGHAFQCEVKKQKIDARCSFQMIEKRVNRDCPFRPQTIYHCWLLCMWLPMIITVHIHTDMIFGSFHPQ